MSTPAGLCRQQIAAKNLIHPTLTEISELYSYSLSGDGDVSVALDYNFFSGFVLHCPLLHSMRNKLCDYII